MGVGGSVKFKIGISWDHHNRMMDLTNISTLVDLY